MGLKIDLGGLANLAARFDDRFVNNIAVKAVEFASVEGAGEVKKRITAQEQVRTGNLRNSVGWLKPRVRGGRIGGGVIVGQRVSNLDFVDRKTGKRLRNVSQPIDYAQHVEARQPYMEPTRLLIAKNFKNVAQDAIDAYVSLENSR